MIRENFLGMTVRTHRKGGNSQKEMANADKISQQQLALQQQQLQMQQGQLNMVNPSLQAIISNGGMLPAQEAAMRSAALNQVGAGETNAIGAINQSLVARGLSGGQNAGGGGIGQDFGALQQGLLGQELQGLQNVQLAKGQGLMQALGTGLGEAGMFGSQALGFGSQGVNALGSGVTAANNADQASTGFWGSLIGGLAGLGSAGIGKIPCWVAAELYGGWLTPETNAIRHLILTAWWMRPFLLIYRIVGPSWAFQIKKNGLARKMTKMLFDLLLKAANG